MDADLETAKFLFSVAFAPEDIERHPFYGALNRELQGNETALLLLSRLPAQQQNPILIFAALHYLALEGHPDLGPIYAQVTRGGKFDVDVLAHSVIGILERDVELVRFEMRRTTQTNEPGRCAILRAVVPTLLPPTETISVIDVGTSAGINLYFDQFEVSPVAVDDPLTLTCEDLTEFDRSMELPSVARRIGIDLNPLDLSNREDQQWLRACLWPEDAGRLRRLDAVIERVSQWPPATILRGDALGQLPIALSMSAQDSTPVVINSWFASYLSAQSQSRYYEMVASACANEQVSWVSIEGNYGLKWPAPYNTGHPFRPGASQIIVCRPGGQPEHFGWCHPHGRWIARGQL